MKLPYILWNVIHQSYTKQDLMRDFKFFESSANMGQYP